MDGFSSRAGFIHEEDPDVIPAPGADALATLAYAASKGAVESLTISAARMTGKMKEICECRKK